MLKGVLSRARALSFSQKIVVVVVLQMGQLRVQGRNLVNGRSVLSAFGERRYVRDGMLKGESFTDKLVPKPDGIDWK